MLNRLGARPVRFARYALVLAPLLLVAARCVENTSLYRDGSGNWVLVGEMYNDTKVQGTEMVLGATLFDAAVPPPVAVLATESPSALSLGIVLPLRDPRSGRISSARLRRKEVAARREHNRARAAHLLETFRFLDVDPVVVTTNDRSAILEELLVWADLRRTRRVIGA